MITITSSIALDESELDESFIRASGPGGQHVNTTSSAVQLRFDALHSPNLPDWVKAQLPEAAGRQMTRDGVVVITAEAFRSQSRNREDALERLVELLRAASVRKTIRRPTRPTRAAKARRMDAKSRRGTLKSERRRTE